MLEKAIKIAVSAHTGQVDKAGQPYILHPLRVMMKMDTDVRRAIAVLHDVVEDSALEIADLYDTGLPSSVVSVVDRLTRREGQTYSDFIVRIRGDTNAITVKVADLEDNLDVTMLSSLASGDVDRVNKYLKALKLLKEVL